MWYCNTVLIGQDQDLKTYRCELNKLASHKKTRIIGCYAPNDYKAPKPGKNSSLTIASMEELKQLLASKMVDEFIIPISPSSKNKTIELIALAKEHHITIHLIPNLNTILEGKVPVKKIKDPVLLTINSINLPVWQIITKRLIDITGSIIGMIFVLPFLPFIVFSIKRSSAGPVFFSRNASDSMEKSLK